MCQQPSIFTARKHGVSLTSLSTDSLICFALNPLNYLVIKLDRALTFLRHVKSLRKRLTSRVELLKRLAGSSWCADATIPSTATLALVDSTVEYCATDWCRSAHTRLIDKHINNALPISCLDFCCN